MRQRESLLRSLYKTCTWGIYGDYNILRGLSNIMTDHSNFVQIQKYHFHNEHMAIKDFQILENSN